MHVSCVQFVLCKHITLICQRDNLPLVYLFIYLFLPPNFVIHLSQKMLSLSSSNFYSIFGITKNRAPPLFSVITQP